ncbi:MAG: hypothetical protein JAZ17_06585 [Candidatus Thiodiazotropha endolucinida]|nr:hypothetical protein [Candidatus Thiodiazotropha endolucinida]
MSLADIWCQDSVESAPMLRHDVALTLVRRCLSVRRGQKQIDDVAKAPGMRRLDNS